MGIDSILQAFGLIKASYASVPNSFSSEVYRVSLPEKVVFVKVPYSKEKWYREKGWLTFLGGKLAVPQLLGMIEPDENFNGAFLLSAIPGEPVENLTTKLAFEVGVLHATMHSIHSEEYGTFTETGFEAIPNNDWRQFILEAAERFQPYVERSIDEKLAKAAWERIHRDFEALPAPSRPCVVHMDFRLANLLVDADTLTGVIDFESTRFGSPEIDLVKLYRDSLGANEELRMAYEEGYETVRPKIPMDQFIGFFELYDAFNSIGWSVQRGLEKNRGFYGESLARLKKALEKFQ
ncbi:phosphotransferase family protein [Paenisporosarcina cavernae]|uniref:Aminoglycoside phosphotransferase family protein n=1 Tax=Paenisporosarcina cavernae TaxID=2320858 RepID=A0A385YYU2_9BACL|nr:aminoglycoside phosphotransferase family protein [Paenisporosarcina cavernae]AYC30522.1 aminoglycoside phosphotransferase family protein [Paenisporosarcina cavernae]